MVSFLAIIEILAICLLSPKICRGLEIDTQLAEHRYKNWKGLLLIEGAVLLVNVLIVEAGLTMLEISHYDRLKKVDRETRKFRHDLNNHIDILKALLAEKRYAEADSYIKSMSEKKENIVIRYHSGNTVIDAIINEYCERYKEYEIAVSIEGYVPDDIQMSNFDLCTIFGNLIANSYEGIYRLSELIYDNLSYDNTTQTFFFDGQHAIAGVMMFSTTSSVLAADATNVMNEAPELTQEQKNCFNEWVGYDEQTNIFYIVVGSNNLFIKNYNQLYWRRCNCWRNMDSRTSCF